MRLDMNCIRDILLCIEENTGWKQCCSFVDYEASSIDALLGHDYSMIPQSYQAELWAKHDNDNRKLLYHIRYCIEADLIQSQTNANSPEITISDLTVSGHEFLGRIRNDKNWDKTKNIILKLGGFTLDLAKEVSKTVLISKINGYL